MLPQFTYIASVLDPANSTYDEINKIIGLFINTGTSKPCTQKNWIHKDILYGPKSEGGLNFIDNRSFFLSLKISWVKSRVCSGGRIPGQSSNFSPPRIDRNMLPALEVPRR